MNKNKSGILAGIGERLGNGLFKENPTFVLLLGMCPTLAVTTSAMNGLGMGLTTMVVLAMSNLIISMLRKVIPNKIRIPAFIVIIASFVTIVELLLKAYIPSLYDALGIYIPLIVVNCIILGRAEAYAYSHGPVLSLFDGIGMGLGFSMALTIIGGVRELLGTGKIFDISVMPSSYVPVSIFVMAPGAFFVLAILTAIQNWIKDLGTRRGKDMSKIQSGCGGNCLECDKECKVEQPVVSAVSDEPKVKDKAKDKTKKAKQDSLADKKEAKAAEAENEAANAAKETGESVSTDVKAENVADTTEIIEEISEVAEAKEEITDVAEVKEEISEVVEIKDETAEAAGVLADGAADVDEVKEADTSETEEVRAETIAKSESGKETESLASTEPAEDDSLKPDDDDDEEFHFLNLSQEKRSDNRKFARGKKKRNSDKAKLLLSKAEETLKEDENND